MPEFISNLWSVAIVWLLSIIIITAALVWLGCSKLFSLIFAVIVTAVGVWSYIGQGYMYPIDQAGAQLAIDILYGVTLVTMLLFIAIVIAILISSYYCNIGIVDAVDAYLG